MQPSRKRHENESKTGRENPGGRRPRFEPPESPMSREQVSSFRAHRTKDLTRKNLKSCFDQGYTITPRRIHEDLHLQVQDISILKYHNDRR